MFPLDTRTRDSWWLCFSIFFYSCFQDVLIMSWSYKSDDRPDFSQLLKTLERLPKKRLARSPSHPVQLSRGTESVFWKVLILRPLFITSSLLTFYSIFLMTFHSAIWSALLLFWFLFVKDSSLADGVQAWNLLWNINKILNWLAANVNATGVLVRMNSALKWEVGLEVQHIYWQTNI